MILTADELAELTARRRPAAQARELDRLGIPYRRRTDGSLVVLREIARHALQISERVPRLRLPATT